MELYGYIDEGLPAEQVVPKALFEVTLSATADELRRLSEFLSRCADEMERMGDTFDHIHLADRIKSFESSPHLVVMRSRAEQLQSR